MTSVLHAGTVVHVLSEVVLALAFVGFAVFALVVLFEHLHRRLQ